MLFRKYCNLFVFLLFAFSQRYSLFRNSLCGSCWQEWRALCLRQVGRAKCCNCLVWVNNMCISCRFLGEGLFISRCSIYESETIQCTCAKFTSLVVLMECRTTSDLVKETWGTSMMLTLKLAVWEGVRVRAHS